MGNAVRALADYIALVLITLSKNQQERVKVLQNLTMMAPRWCSACVMQTQTRLVPVTTRMAHITVCRVAEFSSVAWKA